jgi:hypothetical protein
MATVWLMLFTMACNASNHDCKLGNGGYFRTVAECRQEGDRQRSAEQITDFQCVRRPADTR